MVTTNAYNFKLALIRSTSHEEFVYTIIVINKKKNRISTKNESKRFNSFIHYFVGFKRDNEIQIGICLYYYIDADTLY